MLSTELSDLITRDLTRLRQEIEAFPDDETLWRTAPGVSNSAGNLALHLEGNLREFIGRQLGGVEFQRQRDLEFSSKGLSREDLVSRIDSVIDLLTRVIPAITEEQWATASADQRGMSGRQFMVHLYGHLSYHLGQIDYARRFLTGQGAMNFARIGP